MKVGDIKRLPKVKGNGYFIVKVVGLTTYDGVQYAEVVPVDFNGNVREVNADRLLDLMTREDAQKTLKENLCAMCAYGSQNMDSCNIRSCDNRDAIKVLDQEPCEDSVSRKAVLNLAKDLDFSGVKGLEHYKHRCIEIEDVEQLPPVTPDLSSLREINKALTKRVKYLEDMEKYATPKTFIHRDRTVQDFVEKCRECGRQKTGKWIRVDHNKVKCSKCEITHLIAQYPHGVINFCPNCGSRNEVE